MNKKYFTFPSIEEVEEKTRPIYWVKTQVKVTENIFFQVFGSTYVIPKWFISDGNSFPGIVRAKLDPFDPRWLFAWLIHDYLFVTQFIPFIFTVLLYFYAVLQTAWKRYAIFLWWWVLIWSYGPWKKRRSEGLKKYPQAKHDLKIYMCNQ